MFINCSNHPIEQWGTRQIEAAEKFGELHDYPFPDVRADTSEDRVAVLADHVANDIIEMKPDVVMCQGEFTLTYALVSRLKMRKIPVCAACSERRVHEEYQEDGTVEKISQFQFVRFRFY